ncbi:Transposase family Tnp2 protein [Ceratobasidium theobromae]|uniref:Transposase family Tnp2 protein n=1 Tax=Ceratobasidium theobromae TaxID=1582974 RepID=A0A5N5QBB1_9AGAM|nr:Transposase family Tnp2 protein [Ceratobasidium theobromae]
MPICFCCGKELSERTIRDHRAKRIRELEASATHDVGAEARGEFSARVDNEAMDIDAPPTNESEIAQPPDLGFVPQIHQDLAGDCPRPTDDNSDDLDDTDILPDIVDIDPPFIERDDPPGLDLEDEPELSDDEFRQMLDAHHIVLENAEWMDLHSRILSKTDRRTLQLLATRLRTHFSRNTYNDLRFGVCEDLNIPSEFIAWRRLRILSGLETRVYDCCVNSCICYLGQYKDLDKCKYCGQPRYNARGTARRCFRYTPLIPQLQGLFQSATTSAKLRYRVQAEQDYEEGIIHDVFDAENYRSLRGTPLSQDNPYCAFTNPEDIALGLSTDGVSLFK